MHIARFCLLSSMAVLALSAGYVSGAVIEIPDEILDSARFISLYSDGLRQKRQLNLSGPGSEHAGTIRLDGQRNIFDNGRTRVDGTGSYQLDYARGMKPIHGAGLGAEVNHNIWRGRGGQSLDLYGGATRQFNFGNRPNEWGAHGGIRYNF
uniref:Probable antibacterial peptide n=1 Tax=Riptortus clavatus TaxID=41704 RepID=ABP2_RIPCL|nr:RecName: Full=Probable antibacterial peptide; Flags: Precursor [Riptortus clavatus]BAA08667.1 probable precursor of antibacterial peptide [Riptortus clavatus]